MAPSQETPANRPVLTLIPGGTKTLGQAAAELDAPAERASIAISDGESRLWAAGEALLAGDYDEALNEIVTAVERITSACTIVAAEAAR